MRSVCVILILGAFLFTSPGATFAKAKNVVVKKGRNVTFEYTLTVDGKVYDTSVGQKPITYKQGDGSIIPGLSRQMEGMGVGEEKDVTVKPSDGYGNYMKDALREVPVSKMPKDIELKPGAMLQGTDATGRTFMVKIVEVKKDTVVVDHNHPLAGKTLKFHVKIVAIE